MAAYNTIGRILATERIALQQAQTSLDNVEQRLAKLRAEVAKLEPEADALNAHITAATSVCQNLLSRFLREFFGAAPDDVLLLIFREVIAAHDVWNTGSMHYQRKRAKAPFSLAAVCRRWRHLSISTSALWTYFGLPQFTKTTPAHLDRIVLLTQRSQCSSVDVVVDWSSQADRAPHRLQILNVIGSLAARFRRVEWNTQDKSYGVALEGLQGPTPRLTHLGVRALPNEWSLGRSCLPHAPRLQNLMWDSDMMWTFAAPCYKSLTVLTIWSDPPLPRVLDLLCIVRDVLEELNLSTDMDHNTLPVQEFNVDLPRLVRLYLYDWRWTTHLRTPVLAQLAISCPRFDVGSHPLDTTPLSAVTNLILANVFDEEQLDSLARLDKMTTLKIGRMWRQGSTYGSLSKSFLSSAMARDPPAWPRLKHLHFESGDDIQPVDSSDLVAFIRARNGKSTTSPGETEVSRIDSICLDYDAPAWLVHEVERLTVCLKSSA